MYLSYQTIKKCSVGLGKHRALIFPFVERERDAGGLSFGCGPASYDVRSQTRVTLKPGDFARLACLEHLNMPADLIAFPWIKSSWARRGVILTPAVIDPGFHGHLHLGMVNLSKDTWQIDYGTPIAQIVFAVLDDPTEKPYDGKYQGSGEVPIP
jgi:dCTP deaminase